MFTVKPYKKEELGEKQALFYGSNFMQTIFWSELKQEYGFKPIFFVINTNEYQEGVVVLIRPVFKGLSLAYIPHGPSNILCEKIGLKALSSELKKFMPKGTLFIRYDLLLDNNVELESKINGLKKSSVTVQVPDTTILNLEHNLDDILAGMHKKTRYNIKLAEKKGVQVQEVPITELDRWYDMYEVTAKRDSIAIHSKKYYLSVYNRAKSANGTDIKLLLAEHEGDLLAGIFVLIQNSVSTYLYGASSNVKRNLMPAYLLQWEAIKISKNSGALAYDFFGIPPMNDENHTMHGLYRFKVGFGGDIVNRVGCYDYYLSPIASLFCQFEKLRTFYFKKLKR